MTARCFKADLLNPSHTEAVVKLLNDYANDFYGGGEPLPQYSREHLIAELAKRPTAHVFLAEVGGILVGLSICFEGFSTFACKPLMNIHDMFVAPSYRRQGISTELLFYIGIALIKKT